MQVPQALHAAVCPVLGLGVELVPPPLGHPPSRSVGLRVGYVGLRVGYVGLRVGYVGLRVGYVLAGASLAGHGAVLAGAVLAGHGAVLDDATF